MGTIIHLISSLALLPGLVFFGSAAAAAEVEHVTVNGTSLAYVDEGRGTPVVFIHGGLADLRTWAPIQPLIAANHRFIALNLRYFGPGDWPDQGQNFTATTHIEDVAAFVRGLDAGPVHLVGWSFGSDVATGVALAHPELVTTLIVYEPTLGGLIDAGPGGDAARAKQGEVFGPVLEALKTGDIETGTKRSVEGVLGMKAGDFDTLDEGFRSVFLENARTLPLWLAMPEVPATCDSLARLKTPTLVIHSDAGQALFDHIAAAMAKCLPNGKLAVMANANHAGPAKHPDVMTDLIESFIAGN